MDSHRCSVIFYVLLRILIAARHLFILLEAEPFELEVIESQTAGPLMIPDNYLFTDEGLRPKEVK